MVPSRTTPGAYWLVIGGYDDGHGHFTCTCPRGRASGRMTTANHCRHVRLVSEAEGDDGIAARPRGIVVASAFTD